MPPQAPAQNWPIRLTSIKIRKQPSTREVGLDPSSTPRIWNRRARSRLRSHRMGFFLSLLYLVVTYLGATTVFGALAAFHVELIAAGLILLVSIPALPRASALATPQSLAVGGLSVAAVLSILTALHWPGGAVQAFMEFIPSAFAFFLVALYFNSKKKLHILVVMLLFVCFFVIGNGYVESLYSPHQGIPISGDQKEVQAAYNARYLLALKNNTGQLYYRLRGQDFLNDPNDFSQLVLCVIPLMFVFWRNGKKIWNTAFVLLPVSILLFGIFLTHSRGALVALTAMVVLALRRRIGTFLSLAGAGGLFVLATVSQFTAGREISASAGADRLDLWGQGLELFKSHFLFGVGLRQMEDLVGQTAHNSIVVCAAELGLFGLFFWTLFLVPTVMDTLKVSSPNEINQGDLVAPAGRSPYEFRKKPEMWSKAEINRWGRLIALSLTGFLVAGFFLSRALILTFFLLGGIAEAVYQIAFTQGMIAPRAPMSRTLKYSAGLTVMLVLFMWIVTRTLNVLRY